MESTKKIMPQFKTPLVSIVTPSFNQGKYIEDNILSVKNQNYKNIEHIIIDGGSKDNTLEILQKYQHSYNMYWISEPDKGQANAINKGFKLANGEIVGWLNSDDIYFDVGVIKQIVHEFYHRHKADIIYGDVVIINEKNFILKVQCFPKFNYQRMLRGDYIGQPGAFFRRKVVIENLLDENLQFGMDYEFWLRLGKKYNFIHIPKIIAGDRNHTERKILKRRNEMVIERDQIMQKYGQDFGLKYRLGKVSDKIIGGLFCRLKGSWILFRLPYKEKLCIPLTVRKPPSICFNQLWRKNKNIH